MKLEALGAKLIDRFLLLGFTCVLIMILLAVMSYLSVFNNGLSHSPDSWAAFGSFFGGVVGSIASVVTLLAVLKTIFLQKELLDVQRSEFSAMQALQNKMFESQLAQINRDNKNSERKIVEETRLNVLKTLEFTTRSLSDELDVKRKGAEQMMMWGVEGKIIVTLEKIEKVNLKIKAYERRLAEMMNLHISLCFDDYEDAKSIKDYYQSEMTRIFANN